MAFQVKSFVSITASMINRVRASTRKISDFNIGSVIRTLLEAVAQEIDELYQRMLAGLLEAIPVSIYTGFDVPALPALPATGPIRITVTAPAAPLLVAAGTAFVSLDGTVSFTSTVDVTVAAGATFADAPVACAVTGVVGNIAAGVQFTVMPAPEGLVSAANLVAFTGGAAAETAAQRKVRFRQFIQTLSRATCPSLVYALLQKTFLTDAAGNMTERVKFVAVVEPYKSDPLQPLAYVQCYIHNGVSSTSDALVAFGQRVIDGYYDAANNPVPGYKAAGVKVVVAAATEQAQAITAGVTVAAGHDPDGTAAAVQTALAGYILGTPINGTYLAAMAETLAMAVPGVTNYAPTLGTADVAAAVNVKLMPGALAITGGPAAAGGGASAVGVAP